MPNCFFLLQKALFSFNFPLFHNFLKFLTFSFFLFFQLLQNTEVIVFCFLNKIFQKNLFSFEL